ncbi:MAG: prolipoprotein diacylglyceryl transferase [Anaerolineales bacterium]|nr:prolipoprotein diacylglyceryl transferase [Anaerolineales bacterium]
MITIGLDPVLLSIGHFAVRWYGVIVAAAIGVGVWLGAREAARKGFNKDAIYDASLWIVLGGLVGARLFHVLDHWPDEFAANPLRALYVWEGGLAIWGGVAGGVLMLALLAWRRGWPLPRLLDAVAPGVVLAQAVGRVACIITGDAVGRPTTGPLGLAYTHPNAMVPQLGVYYTPMPLYEIIANLAIFAVLWSLRGKRWPDGRLFLIYLVLYSVMRFGLAYASAYQIVALGLTQSQVVALVALSVAVPMLAWTMWRPRQGAAMVR